MADKLNILVVEDDEDDFIILEDTLQRIPELNVDIEWADSFKKASLLIEEKTHDIYLLFGKIILKV